ncbi:MAG: UDP-N-acetylmuramoyl-tripeptide--D-alanyl-D-alanine ligase, partial [Prevotella sp.]|nr:UDP-N-acetylmuramoyl-tripeptide--D-alanyl-D-alanine ligase [Prevotella sp.]
MNIKDLYELYRQHPVITTDSRECPEGSIFIALKGASFNGNQFALSALEKGCAYAIVDEESEESSDRRPEGESQLNGRIIKVDDCLQTFKDLAREHRRQFHIPVIGITGTNGKTTTKELISTVLSEKYNVLYTQGNFNNDVGVPKTLLRLKPEHEIAVIEMGASHPGDIKTLVETVEPTCGLITNVGRAHLQGFGSFEGVKKTKGELYDYLKSEELRVKSEEYSGGTVFINADNEHLMGMARERGLKHLVKYGQKAEDVVVRGRVTKCDPFLNFEWKKENSSLFTLHS